MSVGVHVGYGDIGEAAGYSLWYAVEHVIKFQVPEIYKRNCPRSHDISVLIYGELSELRPEKP